jgi:hypothetical protein
MKGGKGGVRGKERGKVRGVAGRVRVFRVRIFFLYLFLDLIKLVRFSPVQSI